MSLLFNLRARIKTFLNSSSVVCLFFVCFRSYINCQDSETATAMMNVLHNGKFDVLEDELRKMLGC